MRFSRVMPDEFHPILADAIRSGDFIRLTLGNYKGSEPELKRWIVRQVELRSGPMLSFTEQFKTRDLTKNHPYEVGLEIIREAIRQNFHAAHLMTVRQDYQWQKDSKGREKMTTQPPTQTQIPERAHNRRKSTFLPPESSQRWKHALGLTTAQNQVKPGMADKARQIERFSELLHHHVELPETAGTGGGFRALDMGSGKGYLTFVLFEHLRARVKDGLQVVGVETRADLVSLCNQAAVDANCSGLQFLASPISEVPDQALDLLVALHACDLATDDALHFGVRNGAEWIFVAPCCHKELRPQVTIPEAMTDQLRHGIFLERHVEMLTDSLRGLYLESAGYRVKIFEFVSPEHTGRNILLAAQLDPGMDRAAAALRYQKLKSFYGLGHIHLDRPDQQERNGS